MEVVHLLAHLVWPDVIIKSSPTSPKSCQKCIHNSFYFEIDAFLKKPKHFPNFWATFVIKFVLKKIWKIAQSGHADGKLRT